MKAKLMLTIVLLFFCQKLPVQDKPSIPATDRVRVAEAFKLNEAIGDRIWPGWAKIPFAVLLITPDYEFLVRHPQPSKDFAPLGYDPLLKSDVYFRKRKFPTQLLATARFIQGSGIPTIARGKPKIQNPKHQPPGS